MRYAFTIEENGKTYNCEREVSGVRVLRQTIYVDDVGSKEDSASYGSKGHPINTMGHIARLIAREVIAGR